MESAVSSDQSANVGRHYITEIVRTGDDGEPMLMIFIDY